MQQQQIERIERNEQCSRARKSIEGGQGCNIESVTDLFDRVMRQRSTQGYC
jgi:hypothetical protein